MELCQFTFHNNDKGHQLMNDAAVQELTILQSISGKECKMFWSNLSYKKNACWNTEHFSVDILRHFTQTKIRSVEVSYTS